MTQNRTCRPGRGGLCRSLPGLVVALSLLLGAVPAAPAADAPSVSAAGAIVMDFQTGEFYYEKNADVPRPIASMTKVMSVYLVFEEIAAGRLSLDSYVTASSLAASISNNSAYSGLERLRAGGSYTVDTLLRLIMTASCNGSVIVLAEHIGGGSEAVFVQRMNDKAQEWGIDAHFADACGFTDEGNAVTPRAMAYIAKRIITDYPQILEYSSLKSTTFQNKTFTSTNSLLRNGTCEGIDGLKSGTTNGAGHCYTGTAQRDGRRIISVVMKSASFSTRMSETNTLLEYGFLCRTEREAAWSQAIQELQVSIVPENGQVYPYVQTTLTATLSGLSAEIPCTAGWEINGTALAQPASQVILRNGETLQTTFTAPTGAESLTAALVLTLPDGSVIRREGALPMASGNLSFTGHLGVQEIEMYPEFSLPVPLHITCDQGLSVDVPAGWYLNGVPIPEYQNNAFHMDPDGFSLYTLHGEWLTPGSYVLEFRLNPNNLPGVNQTFFRADILVLDSAQAA